MSTPPVLVVLCASQDDAPPQLAALADRVDLRIATEADLGEALRGARALFLWDFFSSAVRDVWPRCGDLEWIHVAAAGVDTLLFDELRASEVVVTTPGASSTGRSPSTSWPPSWPTPSASTRAPSCSGGTSGDTGRPARCGAPGPSSWGPAGSVGRRRAC
ncbi:hypothetical protein [Ornithinimicrobium sp. CNJ-824]|uniref:hypothetical protein n=1 Tax=Ornithinimicrobium sp. CNJ-824 TaxID=1904966 RepID=UPI0031584F64